MRRKSVKKKESERSKKLVLLAFILTVLLAFGAYYSIWRNQSYGRSVEGARNLAEIWMKREALTAERPATAEIFEMTAENGCCVWLEWPAMGSQLVLNVPKGNNKCYEDPLVRQQVERGYVIVDISSGKCPR